MFRQRFPFPASLPARLLGAALLAVAAAASLPAAAADKQDFSAAEKLLFMSPQLKSLKPPVKLHYRYRRSGALEPGFEDDVSLDLTRKEDGGCCAVKSQYLTGSHELQMPEVPAAEGNPVILYFLERDVREMNRLAKGTQNYFRKRLRLAIYQSATVRQIELPYQGKSVAVQEVRFAPFDDDPNRNRFEQYARKEYRLLLSDAVPGGVYGMRTQMNDPKDGAPPMMIDELWADGVDPAALQR